MDFQKSTFGKLSITKYILSIFSLSNEKEKSIFQPPGSWLPRAIESDPQIISFHCLYNKMHEEFPLFLSPKALFITELENTNYKENSKYLYLHIKNLMKNSLG